MKSYPFIRLASGMLGLSLLLFFNNTNAQFIGGGGFTVLQNNPDFVGIGMATPLWKLDVDGDINLPLLNSYKVSGNNFLTAKDNDNILLGLGTGNGLITGWGNSTSNIFIGNGAGGTAGYSYNNVFIGHGAGSSHNSFFGGANTFLGNYAGQMSNAPRNTFIGTYSGFHNTGESNTYVGAHTGPSSSNGNASYSTFVGENSGSTVFKGTGITLLGQNANAPDGMVNATAIGYNAYVGATNALVLGTVQANTRVGIGTTTPLYKLTVINDMSGHDIVGVRFITKADPAAPEPTSIALWATGQHGTMNNIGVQGFGEGSCKGESRSVGVHGRAKDGNINIGVEGDLSFGKCEGHTPQINIGVQGDASNANGPALAGNFIGDVVVTGVFSNPSDINLKKDITDLNVAGFLSRLSAKSYTFKRSENERLALPDGIHFGFLAQELEQVYPNLVTQVTQPDKVDQNGNVIAKGKQIKVINYIELIPVLTAGIQEQQKIIEKQNAQITQIEAELAAIKASGVNRDVDAGKTTPILTSKSSLAADPNPFQKATKVSYDLTGNNYAHAEIKVQDRNGLDLKQISLTDAKGEVVINSSDLSTTGVYYVYLTVDNNIVDVIKVIYLN